MMSQSTRVQKVDRLLFEALSSFLIRELQDPLPAYASITAVETNANMRQAKIFFRLVGTPEQTTSAREILEARKGQFQKYVAQQLQMKFCPVLRFEFGVSVHRDEIDTLLENLRTPRTLCD